MNSKEKLTDSNTRLRILYLYQLLLNETDEDHPLSTEQIRAKMQDMHGIYMHRTTLPSDIELLRSAGIAIEQVRTKSWNYYIDDRSFFLPEIKILIDAVQSSRFITEKKSKELVEKLIKLTSKNNAEKLHRTLNITDRVKTENEKSFYIVDSIHEAISLKKKISFLYFDYDNKKHHVLKNNGEPYTVSPYDLVYNGDFYYLIGYCDERNEIRTFRVDRIEKQPTILEDCIVKKPVDYSLRKYTEESFRMYSAQEIEEVTLLCKAEAMKYIIDKSGSSIRTKALGEDRFQVKVKVCVGPTFYRWLFGHKNTIAITAPKETVDMYKAELLSAISDME